MLEILVAGALVVALLLFALAGGADFGGGVWTVFARGENRDAQAHLVDRAIGPLWETNELWIVVALVILWSGFPVVFATFGVALFIPLILVLAGILLRGSFLAFLEEAEYAPQRRAFEVFGRTFGVVSVISPVFFGMAAGTISSGRLSLQEGTGRFDVGAPAEGYFEPWLGPFPVATGILALATCMYLSAIYLTLEATDDEALQELFRRRGMISAAALGVLGLAALPVARADAPYMWQALLGPPGLLLGLAAAALASSVALLYLRRFWWARTAAILQVVSVFAAWVSAQYPYLLVDDITIGSAAAPDTVLVALLVLSFFYAVLLGPSLVLLFTLFKRRSSANRSGR